MTLSRPFGRALAAVSLLGVALLTLMPLDGTPPGVPRAFFGQRFGADVIDNVLFFVPLGIALVLAGLRPRRAFAIGLLVSATVEALQLFVPGRHASPLDVLANGLGAALGAGLAHSSPTWLRPTPRAAARLVLGWSAALAVVYVLTAALLSPAVTPSAIYGQWTANLGSLAWYRGEVHAAFVGDVPVPAARLDDSDRVQAMFASGAPLVVRATAGPPISELGPLFSVFDESAREVLLLGIRGDDLVLRRRTLASNLRLTQPELRVPDAVAGLAPGDPLHVAVRREGGATCIAVNDRDTCGLGFSVASGWGVIRYPQSFAHWVELVLDPAWMAALLLPLGFWSLRTRETAVAWAIALGGAASVTVATDLVAPSVWVMLGGAAGAGLGAGLRWVSQK